MTTRRVAALYDVHGNLPALEAVLAERDVQAADIVLVGGDAVVGPFPCETLDALLGLGERAVFIRGNTDRALGEPAADDPWADRNAWVRDRLGDEGVATVTAWPETLTLEVDGLGSTLFCHGSPRSDEEMLLRTASEERLAEVLADVEADVVVCGHTHMQFDRRVGGVRVVNAGSVGLPHGAVGAHWALLGPDVDLRRTDYDREEAARLIRETGWSRSGEPERMVEHLLRPPSRDEVLDVFEQWAAEQRGA